MASSTGHSPQDHFAHCMQVFGGVTSASRRLGIDERALRRFVNGERPISTGLLEDTAKALRDLIAEATEAEAGLAAVLKAEPKDQ
ncbi:helix-turn-helix transcriptional regulator [Novosphingobium sp.]|uniref:helix-turn-helix domain-containing protein n=1 Tax=Novosphingobium sp. TaxID=1874826 RepID=UPI0031E15529